ncbi:hypothetical protein FK178_00600 [Antarcticibacterium arcticum]|uniref:YdhG-like domain-containing protein n=1 Tax=Antarcticibacterium arcticum TaxID=2585771 RepID=A0A5B8YIU5_9FLAO|nr:DUF1801 domain-containing protein [Antarcticibacterium arcticum]QED36316.1 hypothetical protein FK178_00600 [Antarcticibacterium arcticum]
MKKINTTEEYIAAHPKWRNELESLRQLIKSFPLHEGIKWSMPVYDIDNKNILGIAAFKSHYGIWFFNGGLHENNTRLLINAQEGKTHAMRQIKFDENTHPDMEEISKYIAESIEINKRGIKMQPPPKKEITIPAELKQHLISGGNLEAAFNKLTPGKRREYCVYIDEAKREETRKNRVQKIIPLILSGMGLNDRYKPE